MEKKNVTFLKSIVRTKYNDLEGLISIDTHSPGDFEYLCSDYGIDMNKYFLLGIGFTEISEMRLNGIEQDGNVICNVLLLEKEKYGYSIDEISRKIGSVETDIIKKRFEVKFSDIIKHIKRFNFMVVSELSAHLNNVNLIE